MSISSLRGSSPFEQNGLHGELVPYIVLQILQGQGRIKF